MAALRHERNLRLPGQVLGLQRFTADEPHGVHHLPDAFSPQLLADLLCTEPTAAFQKDALYLFPVQRLLFGSFGGHGGFFPVTEEGAGTELEHFVNVGDLVGIFTRKERTVPDGNGAHDAALVQNLQISLYLLQFPTERLGGQQKGSGILQGQILQRLPGQLFSPAALPQVDGRQGNVAGFTDLPAGVPLQEELVSFLMYGFRISHVAINLLFLTCRRDYSMICGFAKRVGLQIVIVKNASC